MLTEEGKTILEMMVRVLKRVKVIEILDLAALLKIPPAIASAYANLLPQYYKKVKIVRIGKKKFLVLKGAKIPPRSKWFETFLEISKKLE